MIREKKKNIIQKLIIDGDYLVFETDHFSTYELVENTGILNNIEVPKTADGIISYLIFTIISVLGIVFITKQIKKVIKKM